MTVQASVNATSFWGHNIDSRLSQNVRRQKTKLSFFLRPTWICMAILWERTPTNSRREPFTSRRWNNYGQLRVPNLRLSRMIWICSILNRFILAVITSLNRKAVLRYPSQEIVVMFWYYFNAWRIMRLKQRVKVQEKNDLCHCFQVWLEYIISFQSKKAKL